MMQTRSAGLEDWLVAASPSGAEEEENELEQLQQQQLQSPQVRAGALEHSFKVPLPFFFSPFSIYARWKDLERPSNSSEDAAGWRIAVIAFSQGANKVVWWGWYLPLERRFVVEDQCSQRLTTDVSRDAIPAWLRHGFQWIGTITGRRDEYAPSAADFAEAEYVDTRLYAALLRGEISDAELDASLGVGKAEEFWEFFREKYHVDPETDLWRDTRVSALRGAFAQELTDEMDELALKANSISGPKSWTWDVFFGMKSASSPVGASGSVTRLIGQLRTDFFRYLVHGGWSGPQPYSKLPRCPEYDQCLTGTSASQDEEDLCALFDFGSEVSFV